MTYASAGDAPPDARDVLKRRARELARPAPTPMWGRRLELIRFAVAGEWYAVEAEHLHHVFRLQSVSVLPGAEPPISAVVPWRGQILPVLDLREALRLPPAAAGDARYALVVGGERPAFAVLVDSLPEPMMLATGNLRRSAPGTPDRGELVKGITDDAVLVLDARELTKAHG